jgi:hypothetical protein
MTTLAQELALLAQKKYEEEMYVDQCIDDIYHSIINNIKNHKCQWHNNFTNVSTSITLPNIKEPLVEYVEFYYIISDLFKDRLTTKLENTKSGFNLVSIEISDKMDISIRLIVQPSVNQ